MTEATIYPINDLVWVEVSEGSSKIVIECENRLGTGMVLEAMAAHTIGTVPPNWREIIEAHIANRPS